MLKEIIFYTKKSHTEKALQIWGFKNFSRENSNNFVSTNLKKEHCH